MTIQETLEKIAVALHCHEKWPSKLDDTNPGHYGVQEWDFRVAINDIRVNIPNRSFTFKDGALAFEARLLASTDGLDMNSARLLQERERSISWEART